MGGIRCNCAGRYEVTDVAIIVHQATGLDLQTLMTELAMHDSGLGLMDTDIVLGLRVMGLSAWQIVQLLVIITGMDPEQACYRESTAGRRF